MDQREVIDNPVVVPRIEVPVSSSSRGARVEVRPFEAHPLLRAVVPSSTRMAWTTVRSGQEVELHSHPWPSLLVVLHGRARLTGSAPRQVEQGDVLTLPARSDYGFADVGPGGFRALHVGFPEDRSGAGDVTTLAGLVARNDARTRVTLETPYFKLLRSGTLASAQNRARLRDGIRVFSDAFQNVLFLRQATCRDERYESTFHQHLTEEIGHNLMLTVPEVRRAPSDPILRATASWFCHQMLTLDNIGKAALIHLVLETAGYHFHTLAAPVLAGDVCADYFDLHAEADDEHRDVGVRFLENQQPQTYRRLHRLIEDGWTMFDIMTGRMVHLVEQERSIS